MVRSSHSALGEHGVRGGPHYRQRRFTHRLLPPLDLRSPSGRKVYPY
ncbi:MAG TPA: hypothetical protein VH372_05695 [Actinospica sp.]|nr:hypothetical protein [Actinospica sp.]